MARVLIAGCGDVGTRLALLLAGRGHEVWGLRRRVAALPVPIRPVAADLADSATLAQLPPDLELVFYTAAAGEHSDAAYHRAYVLGVANLLAALAQGRQRPRRLLFTSSTAVYGQDDGSEVDESSATHPQGFSGERLLEGERLLADGPHPATILRLGGIYGPGRTRLIDSVRAGTAVCVEGRTTYTNRIHSDDAAGALAHLATLGEPAPVYLGVDSEPAERCAVLRFLAARLGVPPPRVVPPGDAPPARRHGGSKRCSNARLVASGYRFRYPTFREGYGGLIQTASRS